MKGYEDMRNSRPATKTLSNRKPMEYSSQVGYIEAMCGMPFNYHRFLLKEDQRNYERGRLRVIAMQTAGFDIPTITKNGCAPQKFLEFLHGNDPVPIAKHRMDDDLTDLRKVSSLNHKGYPKPIPTYCSK